MTPVKGSAYEMAGEDLRQTSVPVATGNRMVS